METSKDIREFLMSRRAKIAPQEAGLPSSGRRRVPGLRREEVALLAGVSVEYYIQIERGQVRGVSDEVLHAIAEALRLDDVETTHLLDLARAATPRASRTTSRSRSSAPQVPVGVVALMDAMVCAPAIVQTSYLDILAANALGRALYAPVLSQEGGSTNIVRFIFLAPAAAETFPAWERAADDAVALLRMEATRSPYSKPVTALVGELATRSEEFRQRWAAHDVRAHRRGTKLFHHPSVGDLTLRFEAMQLAGADELTMIGYTAEPASPSDEALRLLASWVATDATPSGAGATDTREHHGLG